MSETALKFGPEWLRALSHGGSVSSPPSSPGPVKFKLADYRYGREEMLALFSKDFPPPDGLQNLGSLCIEQIQDPLAFMPMNLEEQRTWQRSVNSEAVLRGPGRTPINGVGRGRGGSVDRGRGRGRGVGAPYYSRGLSYDEESEVRGTREGGPPGMPLRNKGYERSQSMGDSRGWVSERNAMERTSGAGEERSGATSPQKGRAATDNWRSRGSEEEGGDRWRGLVHSRNEKWGNRGGWREREVGSEGEWEEGRGQVSGGMRSSRPPWETEREKEGQRRQWEEDNLPEWATESAEDKGGSFDATGAFHEPGSSDEEDGGKEFPPPKELHEEKNQKQETTGREEIMEKNEPKEIEWLEEENPKEVFTKKSKGRSEVREDDSHERECVSATHHPPHTPMVNGILSEEERNSLCHSPSKHEKKKKTTAFPSSIPPPLEELEEKVEREEDKLEHMQSVADDLVAKLVEEDEPRPLSDGRGRIHQPPPGRFLPSEPIPPPEDQWYYTDPQGDIQGPFSSVDMAAWCKAGYFKPTLLLRRQCDDKFAQLGDLNMVFGRVPFLPGPAVPPLKVSDLLNAQKVQAERERYEIMQAQIMQKQLYQQQNTLRQQQVLQSLQSLEEWSSLNAAQQQQLFMQHMMSLPPIVPPTLPVTLQSATSTTANTNSQPPNPDMRSSLSSSGTASLPQQPDPIQAFVAQMSTSSSSSVPASSETPMTQPPPSTSPIGVESPLQKLLLQLQRGSQGGVGGGLTTSGAAPIVPGHPSNLGTIPSATLGLEKKSIEQYDAIQSLMSQLTKMQMQTPDNLQQEDQRQREEEQKRIEDERRQFEEQKRAEEERIKIHEIRLQEERIKEEERRKELEAKNQRLEEELRRIQEEQIRRRKEEENRIKEAENKRKIEQQQKTAEATKREEEHKRQQQLKQKQRQEEEARKREEARKIEEARKAEEEKKKEEQRIRAEEEKKREDEERKRKEEKERQQQIQVQEEMRRIALEEERRRMQQLEEEERRKMHQEEQAKRQQQQQQQKAAAMQERMKQAVPAWSNAQTPQDKNSAPSLAEIQKAQEIKERKEREAEAQRENQRQKEAQRQAAEEKQKKEANIKWAARVSQNSKGGSKNLVGQPPQPPIKSLLEIQKEEEKELKKRQEKEQAERAAAISHLSLNAAGVWGSAAHSLSWANRASSGTVPNLPVSNSQGPQQAWGSSNTVAWSAVAQSNVTHTSSGWNSDTTSTWNQCSNQNSGGFWESPDTVKGSSKAANASISNKSPPKAPANQSQSSNKNTGVQAVNSNNKTNKKKSKDESENVKKLFADNISPADNFTHWCKTSLHSMKVHASIDIPTFVGFLADVESPYEVHDYIRSYLGDSKEVKEFAKQYLERRSKARNAQKEKHEDDNILAPAPAVNPASNLEFQEVKTRLKRGRKKMQKVDNSILGFSVSSLERVDVEDGN